MNLPSRVEALANRLTCDCGTPQRHRASCRSWYGAALREVLGDAVPDVPPDPPAVGREALARWFARYNGDPDTFDNPDLRSHPVNVQGRRDYRRQADALLSSGRLVDVADVRARALKPFEELFSGGPDTACRTTWPDGVECVEVPMEDLRAAFDRAVSEREGGTTT